MRIQVRLRTIDCGELYTLHFISFTKLNPLDPRASLTIYAMRDNTLLRSVVILSGLSFWSAAARHCNLQCIIFPPDGATRPIVGALRWWRSGRHITRSSFRAARFFRSARQSYSSFQHALRLTFFRRIAASVMTTDKAELVPDVRLSQTLARSKPAVVTDRDFLFVLVQKLINTFSITMSFRWSLRGSGVPIRSDYRSV